MALDTYAELQTEVTSWLQRSDVSGAVPSFIEFATGHFNAVLADSPVPQMEALATATVTGEWTDLPDDFLGVRYIELDSGERMSYMTPEEFALYAETDITPSVPVYTIADMSFRIYPTQTSQGVSILYYQQIPALVNSSDTNWMLTSYPHAYIACALMYGFDYLHDEARSAKWEARTNAQIELIRRGSRRIAQGASTMAIKAV